jgi:hypothetical protein
MKKTIVCDTMIYTVDENGNVWSEGSIKIPLVGKGRKFTGEYKLVPRPKIVVSQRINNRGYKTVRLSSSTKMVHRLVAEMFIPNTDGKPFINHIDGNKLNNHVSNLEWCTHSENMRHAIRTGLMSEEGRKRSCQNLLDKSKLSIDDVKYIRSVFKKRHPVFGAKPLSEKYEISTTSISYCVNNRTYNTPEYY